MTTLPQDIVDASPEFSVDARPLGAGTFKVAHRIQVGGEKHVLKVVLQPIDDPDAALPERLRREIEAMSRIDSPRVVRIVQGPEVREIGGDHHLCYQEPFFPGGTLDARLPGSLSPSDSLRGTQSSGSDRDPLPHLSSLLPKALVPRRGRRISAALETRIPPPAPAHHRDIRRRKGSAQPDGRAGTVRPGCFVGGLGLGGPAQRRYADG